MSFNNLPTRRVAGIVVPDTLLTRAAEALVREHFDQVTYNHVMRCLCYGFAIADRLPELRNRDREVHALATLFQVIGSNPTNHFSSDNIRFEVDAANVARSFVEMRATQQGAWDVSGGWDKHRLQLLWDAVALHGTPSIAQHKEVEVRAVFIGVLTDLVAFENAPGGVLTKAEWIAIRQTFPRQGFKASIVAMCVALCQRKPETTYDCWVGEIGELFNAKGYSRKNRKFSDTICRVAD